MTRARDILNRLCNEAANAINDFFDLSENNSLQSKRSVKSCKRGSQKLNLWDPKQESVVIMTICPLIVN